MVQISDKNGLDKNREIWALSDQGSWCTFRGPILFLSNCVSLIMTTDLYIEAVITTENHPDSL